MIIQIWDVSNGENKAINMEAKLVTGGIFSKYSNLVPQSFFAINPHDEGFSVTEALTGNAIGKGKSKVDALADARKNLSEVNEAQYTFLVKTYAKEFKRIKNTIKNSPQPLEKKLPKRALVFKKNEGKCFYCNDQLEIDAEWHIEHKHPKSKGGTNDIDNLVPSCRYCNLKKHNKTAKEFLEASA